MLTILLVVGILVFLIVTHELGHFVAAKLFGVRVEEFGIGYPPRAFLLARFGGTDYTINWIPFGGFVRLFGEEEGAIRSKGSFAGSLRWKQATILIAGVVVNALVAFLLFACALHVGIPRVIDQSSTATDPAAHLMISYVVPGSPADAAGIIAGDQILAISDTLGSSTEDLSPAGVSNFVSARGGKQLHLTIVNNKATSTLTIIPANAVIPGDAAQPALGVDLVEVTNTALDWQGALVEGLVNTKDAFESVVISLYQLIAGAFHGDAALQNVVGPVGLVSVVGEASQNGIGEVFALAGFIAVNLAVINLIPIPVLDGGRLFIIALEAVIRRDTPRLLIQILNTVGIALIILLMIAVTYNDVARLLL